MEQVKNLSKSSTLAFPPVLPEYVSSFKIFSTVNFNKMYLSSSF